MGHPRILSSQIKKERDLAIISFVLGSDLRISELLALDLEHIDWVKAKLHVTRKGNNKDVSFPTGPSGEVGRLTVRSAQKMLERMENPLR